MTQKLPPVWKALVGCGNIRKTTPAVDYLQFIRGLKLGDDTWALLARDARARKLDAARVNVRGPRGYFMYHAVSTRPCVFGGHRLTRAEGQSDYTK